MIALEIPDGSIMEIDPKINTTCTAYSLEDNSSCNNRAKYICRWGDGYEYQPAELCEIHFKETLDKIVELAKTFSV